MEQTWFTAALWLALALAAVLLANWFRVSTALSEIVVGTVAQLAIGAFIGFGVAVLAVAGFFLVRAPYRQRDHARQTLKREREEARARLQSERDRARSHWQKERDAFDAQSDAALVEFRGTIAGANF